jgi:hypothetical protein
MMNLYNKFFKIALLLFILTIAIESTILTYYANEHARLILLQWHKKIIALKNIKKCEEILYEYPPQKELTKQEDFKNHIFEAIEKHKLEHGTTEPFLREGKNVDEITKDAWGRELNFSVHTSNGSNYEIISSGEDGRFNSDDDIGSFDDTKSTLKKHQTAWRKGILLFLFSATLFTISGLILLRRFSPRRCGKLILSISIIIFFLYNLLMPPVPSYAVPPSLILTFIKVGILSGIMTGIFLLTPAVRKQKTEVNTGSGNGA